MRNCRCYILLTVITIVLCGCNRITDLAIGNWQGSQEMYILDSEGDPLRFYMDVRLVLSDDHTYVFNITYSGIAQHEETADFKSIYSEGTWSRQTHMLELSNFGTLKITNFSSTNMSIGYLWPFPCRPASELEMSAEERQQAAKRLVTFQLTKQ